jgi:hypothetical protein
VGFAALVCWSCESPRPIGFNVQANGVNGLRIRRHTRHGIELHRLGRPTSLCLKGPSRRAFERAEEELAQRVKELGWMTCWRSDSWTDVETRWEAESGGSGHRAGVTVAGP